MSKYSEIEAYEAYIKKHDKQEKTTIQHLKDKLNEKTNDNNKKIFEDIFDILSQILNILDKKKDKIQITNL